MHPDQHVTIHQDVAWITIASSHAAKPATSHAQIISDPFVGPSEKFPLPPVANEQAQVAITLIAVG
jgi:hypothetical protein